MSHIDSFKHAIVGEFIGLPVYLALEDIDGDFRCPVHSLIIGGGSGEHPAIVVSDPCAAVARFLDEELSGLSLTRKTREAWQASCSLHRQNDDTAILTFSHWTEESHREFRIRCESSTQSNSFSTYSGEKSLYQWLILGIGEFIFFAMPGLAADIMTQLEAPYGHFRHIRYNSILLIPPNMPVYANGGNAFKSTPVIGSLHSSIEDAKRAG
ncbi:hypothetical protein CU669_19220 [Paramagnetospirillum kuznetsovii]|uniref:Uncharacterized protein n=1 Tax=Paramagnetospirillum kuznetsovii TaxID=2053833 RepID=A0A364NT79_9PROT|nr:hypothetical protein [Paramagnetospirillum kuznetsovii]RAU20299.1 hypothetical protein CU669_19220 [Paramagnetospirillum kuznetsovii]